MLLRIIYNIIYNAMTDFENGLWYLCRYLLSFLIYEPGNRRFILIDLFHGNLGKMKENLKNASYVSQNFLGAFGADMIFVVLYTIMYIMRSRIIYNIIYNISPRPSAEPAWYIMHYI